MELLKFTTTSSTEDGDSSPLKRSDDYSFPRRERTPSGNIDPKGAFRFSPRLNRHFANKKNTTTLRIISVHPNNNNHTTSDNSNKNSKTADISTMASSYYSAKLAPPISSATVDGFEFRRDQQLWFIIQVHPCPITIPGSESQPIPRKPYSIYRQYKDVVDFVERLEKEFPWLKAYQQDSQNNALPSFREKDPTWSSNRTRDGTTLFNPHRSQRKDELDRYLQTLFTLESIVIQCRLVSEFFGIWKTDLQFHLNQKDQDPLALHSVSPTASASSKSPTADLRTRSDTSLSSSPWSPDSMSLPTSVDSSPAPSPTLPPSQGKKRGCFLWDVPPNLSAVNRRNFASSSTPGSSCHSSDDSEDDASDHASSCYSDISEETDANCVIPNTSPGAPNFALQKTTSMQNLEEMFEQVLGPSPSSASSSSSCSSSSSSPRLPLPHTTPSAPLVISILPQHKPFRSFGEGSPQFEPSSLAPIPPRTASLVMNTTSSSLGDSCNQQPRRPSSLNPETRPRNDHRAHTRTPSHPVNSTHHHHDNHNNNSSCCLTVPATIPVTSTSHLVVKSHMSLFPLPTSPPLTVPARTDSKPKQSVNVQQQQESLQKKTDENMTPVLITPRIGPKAVTVSTAPLNPKPARTSTAPLSPKVHDRNKRTLVGHKTPSYVTDSMSGISNFTINLQTGSLVSPPSRHPLSPTESFTDSRKQMHPQSIISLLNQTQALPQQKYQPSKVLMNSSGVVVQQRQQQQHPDMFVVTIKVVVNAHMIIALKIQEEEADFMLSVPDLRLRVLNKFRRMSMAIPDEFDLVWVGGDGAQVVLKNDEEIQKALKASANNKLTLRCIF